MSIPKIRLETHVLTVAGLSIGYSAVILAVSNHFDRVCEVLQALIVVRVADVLTSITVETYGGQSLSNLDTDSGMRHAKIFPKVRVSWRILSSAKPSCLIDTDIFTCTRFSQTKGLFLYRNLAI